MGSHKVTTLTFCISTAALRSRVHFFPNSAVPGGPYTVSCSLTVFGKGLERRSVVLDGARLGHPDGLRLEDAFPVLRSDYSGLLGLEIELAYPQERINLLPSHVSVELSSADGSVVFSALPFVVRRDNTPPNVTYDTGDASAQKGKQRPSGGIALLDKQTQTSLVMINASRDTHRPKLGKCGESGLEPLPVGTVGAQSVIEIPLDDLLAKGVARHHAIWGEVGLQQVVVQDDTLSHERGYYLLYRDPATKRPYSVVGL